MLHKDAVAPELWRLLYEIGRTLHGSGFALAGGTNLALRFGHRLSIDLDFFSEKNFDKDALRKAITTAFGQDATLLNETLQSMRWEIQGIKTKFLLFDYPLLQTVSDFDGIPFIPLLMWRQ